MRPLVVALTLSACTSAPAEKTDTPQPSAATNDTGTVVTSVETADTGTVDKTVPVDCSAVPIEPLSIRQLTAPRGYHDVAFDPDGNLLGNHDDAMFKAADNKTWELFLPGAGVIEQMAWMADGDLALSSATTGNLMRMTSEGVVSLLSANLNAYGVIRGPDDYIYTANNTQVHRIDPASGAQEVFVPNPPGGWSPHTIAFGPELGRLYIGAISFNGALYAVDLGKDLWPVGDPYKVANVGGGWHDGLGFDACGNLYIADYYSSALYRIWADGSQQTLIDNMGDDYGHGIEWGSGIGEWKSDAIYLPQPYNNDTVLEVHIGVPEWPRED